MDMKHVRQDFFVVVFIVVVQSLVQRCVYALQEPLFKGV